MVSSKTHRVDTTPPPDDGIFGGIANTFNSVRRAGADLFLLFSLEVRRAGLTLTWMVALGALAAMLIITAWLGLMGALALWAVSLGWAWASAIVAIAAANLVTAAIVVSSCVILSRNLLFPAIRRQLDVPPIQPEAT